MGRAIAATICVVAGDDRKATKAFLAHVAADLGAHDNVLVVGSARPGPDDPGAWRRPARGGALARVTGAAAPKLRPAVVFVEDRLELVPGWIDALVGALDDDRLGAVAPRTNLADGDELQVGVPYRPHEIGLRRQFARDLAASQTQPTEAGVLAGPCLALRRDRLETVGGLEAVATRGYDPAHVSTSLRALGLHLAVVERCYVHHRGGVPLRPDPRDADLPLVTACLIVKDEELELPRCLESLTAVADEIVVYDTGSTDATVEIASRAGARVLAGYWDDDFGRARNDALAACRGQWILWVDADESLVCPDPAGLRDSLAAMTAEREAFVVHIENQQGNEAASTFVHPACRLFRRAYGHWEGRLHELVVARAGTRELARELTSLVRITHRGYLQSHITGRDKAARNIRTAFADLAGDSELDWGVRLASLGRSYVLNGRFEEALAHCRRAAEVAAAPSTARLALRTSVNCLLALGRAEEALEEIDRLRAISSNTSLADSLAGAAHLALDQHDRALEHFGRVRDAIDEDGFEYSRATVAVPEAQALVGLGRHGEAADALLGSIRESGGVDAHVGLLLECLDAAGRGPQEAYDAIGDRLQHFVPQLLQLQPAVADRTLDSWYERAPASTPVLAAATHVARRLDVSRQLVWSSRLRAAGLSSACPLVATSADSRIAPRDRVLAAAAACAVFGDPRARLTFTAAALALDTVDAATVATEVSAIAPALAARFERVRTAAADAAGAVAPPSASGPRVARSVLVVDRESCNPRAVGLALVLARAGHDVTLLAPDPSQASSAMLERRGVRLRGWTTSGLLSRAEDDKAARSSIARCAAERPFDTVLVTARAVSSVGAARAVLPTGAIAVDLASGGLDLPPGPPVDLLLGSSPRHASDVPYALVPAPDARVDAPGAGGDLASREGVIVLASSRCRSDAELSWYARSVGPALAAIATAHPVVICGDDPHDRLGAPVPSAVVAGAVADPTTWLRAARVAVVPFAEDAETWHALAAASGIPSIALGGAHDDLDAALASVRQLLEQDAPWTARVPDVAAARQADVGDPLAELPLVPPASPHAPAPGRPRVRVSGEVFSLASLSQMNRELLVALAARGEHDLSACTREHPPRRGDTTDAMRAITVEPAPPSRRVDLEIRHQWPPDFTPVRDGRLVVMQPWEFGGLPAEWIAPIRDVVDELWVPTNWVRECAIRSGVAPQHVHVVPYGVDVERFRPDGDVYPLRTGKRTKLLFVGGLIERKGIDALLETYLSSFAPSDDVCLVLKPFGSDSVYRTSSLERDVRAAVSGAGAEIEIVDGDLDFAEMAALYRSCDALVHPYRGEGFGMPIAEAMASGLAVVVTDGGAARDFCDERNAWLVAAREVPVRPGSWTLTDAGAWWLEPSRGELAAAMRAVVDNPDTARAKGARGRQRIVEAFTWQHAAERAAERIAAVLHASAASREPDAAPGSLVRGFDAATRGDAGPPAPQPERRLEVAG